MGLVWSIGLLLLGLLLAAYLLLSGKGKSSKPTVFIADPRANAVTADSNSTNWLMDLAREHNVLAIQIEGRAVAALNFDLLEQLLTEVPSDYLLFAAESLSSQEKKRIEQARSRTSGPNGYLEIIRFTPESRRQLLELFRGTLGLSYWTFCGFTERNLPTAEDVSFESDGFVDDTALKHPEAFDLIVAYQLDPADFIRICATRPEQFDRIISIVRSYSFPEK